MEKPSGLINGWDSIARHYSGEHTIKRRVTDPVFLEMVGNVVGLSVLDVGCGDGHICRVLKGKGASCVGVDISTEQIKKAKGFEDGIAYHVMDALDISKLGLEFDKVIMDFLLCNLKSRADLESVVLAASSKLKPLGELIFSTSHPCFKGEWKDFESTPVQDYFETGKKYEIRIRSNGCWVVFSNFHYTLEDYFQALRNAWFFVVDLKEPKSDDIDLLPFNYPPALLVKAIKGLTKRI